MDGWREPKSVKWPVGGLALCHQNYIGRGLGKFRSGFHNCLINFMLYSVITTIQRPTASVLGLVEKLNEVGGKLIVAGDKKGPADFNPPRTEDGPVEYGSHSTGERGLIGEVGGTGNFQPLITQIDTDKDREAGPCLDKPSGAAFSNPSASGLARDSENTSLNRSAIGPASALRADNKPIEVASLSRGEGIGRDGGNQFADSEEFLGGQSQAGLHMGSQKRRNIREANAAGASGQSSSSVFISEISGSNSVRLASAGLKAGSSNWPVEFLSLEDQLAMPFELARLLPVGHYARKNLAYLAAIHQGASCIYETDDDNAPNEHWIVRQEEISNCRVVEKSEDRWVNVYRYFSKENVWPRGLPLDEIRKEIPEAATDFFAKRAPIQQGLVNGSADVDAIWRLVMDREFFFDPGASVYLEPGNWCPFNTQTTWWWPVAYPLLYIPSYCSFRMCDIWKSFVAQRCLWELDMGIVFHAPEVYQDRNVHDLMRDFRDEIPGYDKNREICEILAGLKLKKGDGAVSENLLSCYEALVQKEIFPFKELHLVKAWMGALNE
jgi:hypothetical protein